MPDEVYDPWVLLTKEEREEGEGKGKEARERERGARGIPEGGGRGGKG